MRDPMWRLETRYSEPLTKINQELKDDKWSYKVVFQKALLRSYLELLEQAEEFIGDEYPTIELRTRFTDYWIEAINVLLDSDLGLTKAKVGSAFFWEGSGLQSDATIEYTKSRDRSPARLAESMGGTLSPWGERADVCATQE
jgi:hypothetical protein